MKLPALNSDLALLILRLWFGLEMLIKHGWPKLMKVFSGDYGFPDPIGIGSTPSLFLVTFAEFFCAIGIVLGWFTRWSVIPYFIAMLVAAYFHGSKGDDWGKIANPLHYAFVALALFFAGAGKYSIDGRSTLK